MNISSKEVIAFVEQNDVKFIKLAFFDIFGKMKNVSILASELPRAFETGILFDASCIKGFMEVQDSDLLLFPDPSTLSVLPWRPQQGRVARLYCHIKHPDGTAFAGDGRYMLKQAVKYAKEKGYKVQIGTECEFYLFNLDENGQPTRIPHDFCGYCDVAPIDRGENVRREICLTLEEMGIMPETSHHESGPGQNEIDFKYSSALESADNLATFKAVVKSIASINGLFASFMPRPIKDNYGSGLHLNLSLVRNGTNIFSSVTGQDKEDADSFVAGILRRVKEITLFLNPTTNSYKRLGNFEAPKYVTWSRHNRSQLIRIPEAKGDMSRVELRSPDPSCNPYIALTFLIYAGLEGIETKAVLPAPVDRNLYSIDSNDKVIYEELPSSLEEAIKASSDSEFVRKYISGAALNYFFDEKKSECEAYKTYPDNEDYEDNRYFTEL